MKKIWRELGGHLWQDTEVGPCFKCWISYLRRNGAIMFDCFHKIIVWSIWLYPKIILIHFNVTYRTLVQLEILIRAEAIMPRYRLWNVARIDLYAPAWLWMNNGQHIILTQHTPTTHGVCSVCIWQLLTVFFGQCHTENWKKA